MRSGIAKKKKPRNETAVPLTGSFRNSDYGYNRAYYEETKYREKMGPSFEQSLEEFKKKLEECDE